MEISRYHHQLTLNQILNSDVIPTEKKQLIVSEMMALLSNKIYQYTGGDSSLSKTRSQQLIDSIEYSISMYLKTLPADKAIQEVMTSSIHTLYQKGYNTIQAILQQLKTKITDLQDKLLSIDLQVYQDTLQNGLLSFFTIYDFDYRANDIVLTLDYPVIQPCRKEGLEKLIDYVNYIELEHVLLHQFSEKDIKEMLIHYIKGYQYLIFNVSELLLNQVILKSFTMPSNLSLVINQKELNEINQLFTNKEKQEVQSILLKRYDSIISSYHTPNLYHYFLPVVDNLSTLVYYGVQNHNLKIEIAYRK